MAHLRRWAEAAILVNRVAYGGERIVPTSREKPKAAIVRIKDYEQLEGANALPRNRPIRRPGAPDRNQARASGAPAPSPHPPPPARPAPAPASPSPHNRPAPSRAAVPPAADGLAPGVCARTHYLEGAPLWGITLGMGRSWHGSDRPAARDRRGEGGSRPPCGGKRGRAGPTHPRAVRGRGGLGRDAQSLFRRARRPRRPGLRHRLLRSGAARAGSRDDQ
ncbi:MAG: type II toxin-antitoxin system Phd/YefM family antitoxin [Anaerolineae bacterium]|nr:type II toxin-antitoxin system Phd/YefM family antitoxin [Anaerolineae bacterium]